MSTTRLIRFVTRYVPGSRLNRLCFGVPAMHQQGIHRSVFQFQPGQIFGAVWWRRQDDDRQHRTLAIIEAVHHEQEGQELPDIHGNVRLHAMVDQHGPAGQGGAVDLFLDLIEEMKVHHRDPSKLPARYWQSVAHRVLLCQPSLQPPSSTLDEDLLCMV